MHTRITLFHSYVRPSRESEKSGIFCSIVTMTQQIALLNNLGAFNMTGLNDKTP
jgi:inhibitor of KinA sporulation pathway (predicted exonuclease)